MDDRGRVVIAGGGIGGLAAANALRAAGITPMVLERSEEFTEIGAAIGVQSNAVKALRTMGLADRLLDVGVPIERYEYRSWRGRTLAWWPQGEIARKVGEPTVVVHRADLQTVLLGGLPTETIRLGARCEGFVQRPDGVDAVLTSGQREQGAVLIGADGLRSVVRHQLLGDTPLRYSGWVALRGIAEFEHPSFPVGIARQLLGRARTFGMWHIRNGRVYWVATLRSPSGIIDEPEARKRLVLDAFADADEPVADLVSATPARAVLRNDIFDRAPVPTWSAGRVTLLGDAAHPTTPVTGQGGGQAIIDASVLAAELADAGDPSDESAVAAAFQAYELRRAPTTAAITNEAWRIGALHHVRSAIACGLRDLSFRATPRRVWCKRMETRLAY